MKSPSLNHIYRLVWNDSLGTYVPVAEHANSRRKRNTAAAALTAAALTLAGPALAADLPTGGQVVAGSGSISQNGTTLNVNQQSGKLAIDWQSFSIGKGNTVNFYQPNSSSVALNRVLGSDVSVIQGALNANGQVFLVNPNGVVFSPTAQVNVGGLVASTLNISTADFMAGNYRFEGASSNAIINQGNITAAPGGSIALIAAKISNVGKITADKGNVLLGAGSRVRLDLGGPVKIEVEEAALNALIEQGGAIRADGGTVYLTAKAAGELASTVINHTGITEARTLATGETGKIVLLGDMVNDRVVVAGTLDASAPNGGNGGFIETSGAKISIAKDVTITTKAANGKTGNWLIDPTDFTVTAGTGDQTDNTVGAETLASMLENNSVELQTLATGDQAGDIKVNGALTWNSGTQLTLSAYGNIAINAPITIKSEMGGLILKTGDYAKTGVARAGSDYSISAPVTFSSNYGGLLEINGQNFTIVHNAQQLFEGVWASIGNMALGQDLDLGGGAYPFAINDYLAGNLAGLGHSINNMSIDTTSNSIGLFGTIRVGASVRDLNINNASVRGGQFTGILAGTNYGVISNVSVSGTVIGGLVTGGLVASNGGTIRNSHADVTVSNRNSQGNQIGGLVGANTGLMENVYATGKVTGLAMTGGLAGYSRGTIRNAYATGAVSGTSDVGGLIGSADAGLTLDSSYATGKVTATGAAGGLVGNSKGATITNSAWDAGSTGRVSAYGTGTVSASSNPIQAFSADGAADSFKHDSYANLGAWERKGNSDVWIAKDANGKVAWIMIEGKTRPFLASEFSTGIRNDHQLQLMAYDVGANYYLLNDVTYGQNGKGMWSEQGFAPVGRGEENAFTGLFDGQSHIINNLTINDSELFAVGAGLFGYSQGTIKNVGLVKSDVQGGMEVGSLVGFNAGTVQNSFVLNGKVGGQGGYIGGLVGVNLGTIQDTYFTGAVSTGTMMTGMGVGGLVGLQADGSVRNSFADATLTDGSNGYAVLGGAVGDILGGTVANVFYNTDTAGLIDHQINGVEGITTQEMKQGSVFAGWDINDAQDTTVWRIYEGNSGPLLRSFLTQVSITAKEKTYDGKTTSSDYYSSIINAPLEGTVTYTASSKNAGSYSTLDGSLAVEKGLYSNQLGYDIGYDDTTLTVGKKELTAQLTAADKVYDGTTSATITNGALQGIVAGDIVSQTGGVGEFSDKNAGANKRVTVTGAVLEGDDASNYTLKDAFATATITKLKVTGTVQAQDKVYDGKTTATTEGNTFDILSGDEAVVASSGTFDSKNVGLDKIVDVTAWLTGKDAQNYELTTNTQTKASISKRDVSVELTANDKVYDGSKAATGGTKLTNFVDGDQVDFGVSGTFSDKNAGTDKLVALTSNITGEDAGNYNFTVTNSEAAASISKRELGAVITVAGKTYDATTSATTSGTLSNLVEGDDITLTTSGSFLDKNAGSSKQANVSGSIAGQDSGNYTLSSNTTASAEIKKLAITGDATAADKTYDGNSAATLTVKLNGVLGEDVVDVRYKANFEDKNAGDGKTVNIHTTLSGEDGGNYTLTTNETAKASIAKLEINGNITAEGKTYDGKTAATTSGNLSGVIEGDTVNIKTSGNFEDKNAGENKQVLVSGSLEGDDAKNYTLKTNETATASIDKLKLDGTITADKKTYDGNTTAVTSGLIAGVIEGDDISLKTEGNFSDRNAGKDKTVNVSGEVQGKDAGNYEITLNDQAIATIDQKVIQGTITAEGRVYDGTTNIKTSGKLDGVIGEDDIKLAASGSLVDKNAGKDKDVNVSGTVSGEDAGNYIVLANSTTKADIARLEITGTIVAGDKTYDGKTAVETGGTLNGVLGQDQVSIKTAGNFVDKNAGQDKQVNLTSSLEGDDAKNYSLKANDTTMASIARLQITGEITAEGKTYNGSTAAATSGELSGYIQGDDVALKTSGYFDDKNAGVNKNVNVSGKLSGEDARNYDVLTNDTAVATIDKLAITGTIVADGKVYDGKDSASTTGTLNGVLSGDKVALDTQGSFSDRNAGLGKTVNVDGTLSGDDAQNYDVKFNKTASADIAKREITGTIVADGKIYDGSTKVTTGGLLNGVLEGDKVTLSTDGTLADKNAGKDKLVNVSGTIDGLDAQNYSLKANATTTVDIAQRVIDGDITVAGKTYDGTTVASTSGSLNGVLQGDKVSFVTEGSFADKNAGKDKKVSVSGSLAGEDAQNYYVVANSSAEATIAKLDITGTIVAAGKTYDGTSNVTTQGTLNGTIAGDKVALATEGSFADKNAGLGKTVSVSGALTGEDAQNYSVSTNETATADIAARQLTASLGTQDKVYDGSTSAAVTGQNSLSGLVEGDSIGLVGNFADKNAGSNKAVAFSLTGEDAGNYVLDASQAQASISKRVLTIEGTTVAGKTYDGSNAAQASAGTLGNVVQGDTLGLTASATFDSANAGERTATVSYTLSDDGSGDAGNYALADTQHQATIDRRAITVVANNTSKTVGTADPLFSWTVQSGSLVGNDTLQGSLTRAAGETIGDYRISAAGLANGNYLVSAVDGLLTIGGVPSNPRSDNAVVAAQHPPMFSVNDKAGQPELQGDLNYVPLKSVPTGARQMGGPAQVLVIDGGVRLPEEAAQTGI